MTARCTARFRDVINAVSDVVWKNDVIVGLLAQSWGFQGSFSMFY